VHNVIDFSSWQALLSTLLGLAVFSLVVVGIRLLVMQTVQQRRERENRQINERLRTLIASYKTLGGSFSGNLAVDPSHLRDVRRRPAPEPAAGADVDVDPGDDGASAAPGSERRRRIRDAVEAALSDVVLLGTDEQVRLAAQAATDLAAGRPVHTAELVISLRTFIREVLDLAPIPATLAIPPQGPARPGASARGGREDRTGAGNARGSGGRGGAGAGGGGAGGMGGVGTADDDVAPHR